MSKAESEKELATFSSGTMITMIEGELNSSIEVLIVSEIILIDDGPTADLHLSTAYDLPRFRAIGGSARASVQPKDGCIQVSPRNSSGNSEILT